MNSFKKIASDAKKRLVNGYWEDVYRSREEDIKVAVENGVSSDFVVGAYKERINASISKDGKIVDEEFYDKVYDIVMRERAGEIIINVISILRGVEGVGYGFKDMKEIFEISEAYIDTKRRIESELKIKSLKQLLD